MSVIVTDELIEMLENRRIIEKSPPDIHGVGCRVCGEELQYYCDGRFIHRDRGKNYDHPATPPYEHEV